MQGHGNRAIAQVESVTDLVALKLLLVEAQLAIEGIEPALHPTPGKLTALGDQVVGEAQGDIDERLVLDI